MSGRRHPARYGSTLSTLAAAGIQLPSVGSIAEQLRSSLAIWSRSLADWLVGPVERWCPICELELQLHASDRSCLAPNGDDEA